MGLTIHYSLSLNSKGVGDALNAVQTLHTHAKRLPFAEVKDIQHFKGDECDFEKVGRDSEHSWLLIQSGQYITRGHYSFSVAPLEIIAFTAWPGEGCEESNFGLCRYPKTIKRDEKAIRTNLKGWYWSSFCKTQYACEKSVEHFIQCHLTVVAMLDAAKKMGLGVEVSDEGNYWDNRNVEALAKEVGEWNEMIAGLAGVLTDQFKNIEAPIKRFGDYEHLEAKGRDKMEKGI